METMRPARRLPFPIALALALAGCSVAAPTQLVVVVDTDLAIPRATDAIRVEVVGPSGMRETERATLADGHDLPLTLGVAPSGGSLGPIEVIATAHLGVSTVVERRHRVTLVQGETRTLILHLTAECAARATPCAAGETCGENGCLDVDIDAAELPAWGGTPPRLGDDAGPPPPRDAGQDGAIVLDGGDGGEPVDGGPIDGGPPPPCTTAADCDDGNPCTDDTCEPTGCVRTPNTAACDDGLFCNGLDTCSGGTCAAHVGSPCAGLMCDEAGARCVGCTTRADCMADSVGSWSACSFSGTCAESGTQTRTTRTWACVESSCVPADDTETQACSRSTAGDPCAARSCAAWGSCGGFDGACDESGTESRACSEGVCAGGSCTTVGDTETRGCSRSTTGTECVAASCGTWSACSYGSTCAESGSRTRTCTNAQTCASSSCSGGGGTYEDSDACARSTAGTMCEAAICTVWSACGGFDDECDISGTQTRTCTPRVCSGGGCTNGTAYTDSQGCSRVTTGDPCDDFDNCTEPDTCTSTGFCRGRILLDCVPF